YDSPDAFRLLPESFRVKKALSALGPKGAWWLRDRVEGVLEVLTGHQLRSAKPQGSGDRGRSRGLIQPAIQGWAGLDPCVSRTDQPAKRSRRRVPC
ncbi:MAG TPA: hypothetical protein VN695_05855, partial [Streptosporangiaceae bacterium]|nr:hypothetical protein [Streptosporangiaceae bacterium]